MEVRLEQPAGLLAHPDDVGNGTGVLVVAGSSGAIHRLLVAWRCNGVARPRRTPRSALPPGEP